MMNNGMYIFWDHINDVYRREQIRHLYVTDIRSSHIHLDHLSKMHVKLSKKVASEMNKSDNENTKATQEYITACSKFWDIFNSSTAIRCTDKEKIKQLGGVRLNTLASGKTVWKNSSRQKLNKLTTLYPGRQCLI